MNNLLSYCGLTEARMRASEKDLPVLELKARSEIRADMDNRNVNKFGLKMNICRYAFTYVFIPRLIT